MSQGVWGFSALGMWGVKVRVQVQRKDGWEVLPGSRGGRRVLIVFRVEGR